MKLNEQEQGRKSSVTISASAFVELLNRAIPFAGTDMTLPVLVTVQIEVEDGYMTATSTDRYRMAHARAPLGDHNGEPFKFLLSLTDAKSLVTLFGSEANHIALVVQLSGDSLIVSGPKITQRCDRVSGEAVKFRKILADAQSQRGAGGPFGANLKFVADFKKVVREHDTMRITSRDPLKPILFETTDFVGLLMPVRIVEGPFGFDVMTGDEVRVGFTPSRDFERRITRERKDSGASSLSSSSGLVQR